jgi:hypothetical protein
MNRVEIDHSSEEFKEESVDLENMGNSLEPIA